MSEAQCTEINKSSFLTSMILSFSKEIQISKIVHSKSITGALIGIKAIMRKRSGTSQFYWDEVFQEMLIEKAKLDLSL